MRKIEIIELKQLQLDILEKVDTFCRQNDIKYTLYYGTLIGAIRHKGYIPWDDDIDIAMTRPYYTKFLNTFNGTYDNLHVLAPELNADYYAPYANVCDQRTILLEGRNGHRSIEVGVKIDIFPIDGTPDSNSEFKLIKKILFKLNSVLTVKRKRLTYTIDTDNIKGIIRKMQFCFYRFKPTQYKIMEIASRYDFSSSIPVDNIVFQQEDARLNRECYESYIDVDFVSKKFMAIEHYDELLRKIYGDYMVLPPMEKRVPNHGFLAYWKE